MTFKNNLLVVLLIFSTLYGFGQADSTFSIGFDFNNHKINDTINGIIVKGSDVSLVEDRFGNPESAVLLSGSANSYLNLGTSPLLKSKTASFSLWVNISRPIFYGKGYEANPILILKNSPEEDFNLAYSIFMQLKEDRFNAASNQDSTKLAQVSAVSKLEFNRWYHLVLTSDFDHLSFYVDGKLQGRSLKKFETTFLSSDSLMIGHSASKKNERFCAGIFDDIRVFHKVLSEKEVQDLYNAPNPNKNRVILLNVLKVLAILASIFLVALALVWQRRRTLKRIKDKLDVNRKLHDMEIRTLKAQMNPHFIFNSLNSIQELIMTGENTKAEKYLSKFSKLIRDLLESNANESLLLEEEIGIIKGYIEMEMLRFDNTFNYSIELDSRLNPAQIKLPHLMLQPFIENAIWHGLLSRKGNGVIDIRFDYVNTKSLKCTIDDNGIGREASKLKENTFKRKSLALSIVKQRLSLMSEALNVDCRVDIIDKTNPQGEASGTRVEIILPILN